jgi:hypothetical protein
MASFTLLFKNRIPIKAVGLVVVALVTLGFATSYTIYLNPEVRLYRHASEVKEKWSARLDQNALPKYVVFGGSSCATSVMGERLLG